MAPTIEVASTRKFPDANVLTEGFGTPIHRVPENLATVKERQRDFFNTLCPRNYFHAWISDDVALMTIRLERCARIERRERDRICLRAEFFWDDDRALEAEELGAKLAGDPGRVAARLKRTPHGCDWMIGRWELLLGELVSDVSWTESQRSLAFDLIGRPADFRSTPPDDPAGMARGEIARLRERRVALEPADALDRNLAMADATEQSTPELRRLRRYETTLQKRLKWDLYQLQIEPRNQTPHPGLAYLYEPEPAPEYTPDPDDPTPIAERRPKPEAKAVIVKEPAPVWMPPPIQMTETVRREMEGRYALDRRDE